METFLASLSTQAGQAFFVSHSVMVGFLSGIALLIIAGWKTIKLDEALSIWRTGWPSRLAILTTFTATLFLPVQAAVGIGAALSALLYLNEASTDITVDQGTTSASACGATTTPPAMNPASSIPLTS